MKAMLGARFEHMSCGKRRKGKAHVTVHLGVSDALGRNIVVPDQRVRETPEQVPTSLLVLPREA